jgi:[protein-PII] uridylyltransferase
MPIAPHQTDLTSQTSPVGVVLPPLPSADLDVEAGPDFDLKKISKDYVTHLREALGDQQRAGVGGGELVSHYTAHIDRLIQYLFDAATRLYARRYTRLQQRCAVLAQGGYGRGELNPYSDIDLLFLYHWKVTPYVETICEMIYYSLIDSGFVVGHAVRTVRTCTRLAAQDLQVKTSLLDARPLCGDEQLSRDFGLTLEREIIGKQTKRFFQEKAQESRQRHEQHGNSPYQLEPNVKESPGGLRDLHTAWWLAKVKFKIRSWHELFQKGIVPQHTLGQVEVARDFLWRVRNGMHLATHSEHDQLTIEQQEQLAPQLGFADAASFMYEYYRHATTLHDFSRLMLEQCLEAPRLSFFWRRRGRDIRPGVRIADQTLAVTKPEILTDEPVNMVTVFHDAQRHGVQISRSTQQLVRDTLDRLPPGAGESPAVRSALYAVLNWKQRVADTVWLMHSLGVLGWILPEFGNMQWRIQRDLYHVYTVDEHTLYGVAALEQLREGRFKEDLPLLTQVMREIDKLELLFLAMLYHDVGKGHGSEHDERSAAMVRQAASRWGMAEDDAHEWDLLVQHHLLMSYIAQRRDISDDALIAEFARTVENQDVLKKLYLLTFADMKAVGPKVWNSWKAGLLDELYLRTLERFETGLSVEEDPQARLQRRKDALAALLPSRDQAAPDQVQAFLDGMPDSYFLSTPEEAVPDHFRLLTRFIQTDGSQAEQDPYRLALAHFPEREYSELTVVTHDRPGLFALLTGVLAANNLNVAGARISTSRDGIALDVFRLSHAGRSEVVMDSELWSRLRTRLGAVLRGERTLEDLLQTTRSPSYLDKRHGRIPTEITVDNGGSPVYTVIDVTAPDRTGFLFRVTAALFQLGLLIHLAKITTNVNQVLDVFYVTDSRGGKVNDPDQLAAALQRRIFDVEGKG